MTKKKTKSPQEKKALSYTKDRRNCYGNNDKAARKSIPLRKTLERRRARKQAQGYLHDISSADALDDIEVSESSLKHGTERIGGWLKFSDRSLKSHVDAKLMGRVQRSGRRGKR